MFEFQFIMLFSHSFPFLSMFHSAFPRTKPKQKPNSGNFSLDCFVMRAFTVQPYYYTKYFQSFFSSSKQNFIKHVSQLLLFTPVKPETGESVSVFVSNECASYCCHLFTVRTSEEKKKTCRKEDLTTNPNNNVLQSVLFCVFLPFEQWVFKVWTPQWKTQKYQRNKTLNKYANNQKNNFCRTFVSFQ